MIQITKQQFLERLDNLPTPLQEALFNTTAGDIVWDIGGKHHLTEDKISALADIVTDVLSGFLHSSDLAKEIRSSLDIGSQTADSVAEEIDQKIFVRYRDEISKAYDPITKTSETLRTGRAPKEKKISLEKIGEGVAVEQEVKIEKAEAEEPFDAAQDKQGKPFDAAQGKPLVLFKEKSAVEEKRKPFKGFTFPFGMTKKDPVTPPTKVRVEVPGKKKSFDKAQDKRVVHYSELRTPLSPFGKPEKEIIALKTPERTKKLKPLQETQQARELLGVEADKLPSTRLPSTKLLRFNSGQVGASKASGPLESRGGSTPHQNKFGTGLAREVPPASPKETEEKTIVSRESKKYPKRNILGEFAKTLKRAARPLSVLKKINNKIKTQSQPTNAEPDSTNTSSNRGGSTKKPETITSKKSSAPEKPTTKQMSERDKKESVKGPTVEGNVVDLR